MANMMLFHGNANSLLANQIAAHLGKPIGKAVVSRFSDGEVMVEILENVRGKDVFIVQPTCFPVNENLMELIILADALRRASAMRITAVIPYFGYARQDRRIRSARVPITAKVVADMIAGVGISRVLTVDLHADQIQGFFDIPVDNVYATPAILEDLRDQKKQPDKLTVVSPDVGGVVRARAVAKRLSGTEMAIIDKRRTKANHAEVMQIIGEVSGRHCLIIDDMVDTANTLCLAAKAMKDQGAISVSAYCTHPVLSGAAIELIQNSCIDEVVVTNTLPLRESSQHCDKIRVLNLSKLLAETIRRINSEESVSSMFLGNI